MSAIDRRRFIKITALGFPAAAAARPPGPAATLARLKAGWAHPPRSCRPHTRWWWPGNAVTKEGITWQLEQMRAQGMGGVEIMSCWAWYTKGNIPYLSDQWFEMVRHAVREAARLDMEVALTFGPGWSFGGFWVPIEHRSKVLAVGWTDLDGPQTFEGELPDYQAKARALPPRDWKAPDEGRVIAAVAARLSGESRLDAASLVDLTARVREGRLHWQVPPGRWRLMAFRLYYTGQENQAQNLPPRNWVVDHMNKSAMEAYCEFLASKFQQALGTYLGNTVDSFFCDSFEIHPLPETLLWSTDTLEKFRLYKGYDLTRYLPAIWFDIGELTPRVRYDVNEFLHWLGLETAFATFSEACARRNVQARIQPHYRFPTEIIRAAGATPRPETEVTTARFEVVADPRKSTAAAGRFYGRPIVSAEAYTFLHPERYRTSLEEMKRATDAFLRDGVTQFYNHGYVYSPEAEVAPSRDVPWANRISHWATWWRYYGGLASYISRACWLLRQGRFCGDVLIYSPQATVWTQRVLFGTERRIMPYGDLPKTLVANGYDFDPVNDDVLQNMAVFRAGKVWIGEHSYRFLLLPKITALPVETLERMAEFVKAGGVLIALDELPRYATGLIDYERRDLRVRGIVSELFGGDGKGRSHPGGGRTYFLDDYKIVQPPFSPAEQPWRPTPPLTAPQRRLLDILRSHLPPDFSLDGNRQSDGLTFLHRQDGEVDIYFVTNLQPNPVRETVTFRVTKKYPQRWDALTGDIEPVIAHRDTGRNTEILLELEPWESVFFVFVPGPRPSLPEVRRAVEGAAVPPPVEIKGPWRLTLEGVRFPRTERQLERLISWTEDSATRYFSGTGTYEVEFQLPEQYLREGLDLILDLGGVGDVAEVFVNGKAAGTRWMQPYRFRVTGLLHKQNRLRIAVTNRLINHVSGLREPPEVPGDLQPHYGVTSPEYVGGLKSFERERGFQPLPPSGLLGPVRIVARYQRWTAPPEGIFAQNMLGAI